MSENVTQWCIKLTCLPQGIKTQELGTVFDIEPDRIDIPKQQGQNYYAWVNGFSDESNAKKFEKKWNRINIRGSTIVCKVASTKKNVLDRSLSRSRKNNEYNLNNAQEQFISKNNNSKRNQSVGCTRRLVPKKSNTNDDTKDGEDTNDSIHSPILNSRNGQSKFPPSGQPRSYSLHRSSCRYGIKCFNPFCKFDHPEGWQACVDGVDCEEFNCSANHPYSRKEPCLNGAECKNIACKFLHPKTRMRECKDRDRCDNFYCEALHQDSRPKPCTFGKQCLNTLCKRLHPPDRRQYPSGDDCTEFNCQLDPPPGRMMRCSQGNSCSNVHCSFRHPDDWNPCEDGSECKNLKCLHTVHPSNRSLGLKQITNDRKQQKQTDPLLKSAEQMKDEREKAQLPFLYRTKFFVNN